MLKLNLVNESDIAVSIVKEVKKSGYHKIASRRMLTDP